MLPENAIINDFKLINETSSTYHLDYANNAISGKFDGIEAIKQAIYIMLNTERYKYPIYDWNYGSDLQSLIGAEKSFAIPEIERRITDVLMRDSRIVSVTNFSFSDCKSSVTVHFTVNTMLGSMHMQHEVMI